MANSIQDKILDRLRRLGRGAVFTPKDFLDLGTRASVDQALSRLVKATTTQRCGRGLYYYPKINKRLGIVVPPDVDAIVDAFARQTGSQIAPSGATAANLLGLSTQVPAKPVYLTNGRSRKMRVGNFDIFVKHVAPRELPVGSRTSATVLQALRYIGKDAIAPDLIDRIRKALPQRNRSRLLQDAKYTTDWIANVVRKIVGEPRGTESHG